MIFVFRIPPRQHSLETPDILGGEGYPAPAPEQLYPAPAPEEVSLLRPSPRLRSEPTAEAGNPSPKKVQLHRQKYRKGAEGGTEKGAGNVIGANNVMGPDIVFGADIELEADVFEGEKGTGTLQKQTGKTGIYLNWKEKREKATFCGYIRPPSPSPAFADIFDPHLPPSAFVDT